MINLDLLLIKQKTSIQIHMRKIEKPELISTIRDKKKVWLNIRESRLMYMFHRKLISLEEYEAGSRYRLMCELMGGSTGNYLKDRVDGSVLTLSLHLLELLVQLEIVIMK